MHSASDDVNEGGIHLIRAFRRNPRERGWVSSCPLGLMNTHSAPKPQVHHHPDMFQNPRILTRIRRQ